MNPPREQAFDVAVIGAGPAGTAAAVGLARLGWRVRLYGSRPRSALEGGSPRLLDALRSLRLRSAYSTVTQSVPRTCCWAGASWNAGEEHLVDRARFDAGLRKDAMLDGIDRVDARVREVERASDGWWVRTDATECHTRAIVDARGRCPRGAGSRGPRLLAVAQRYAGVAETASTSLIMAKSGWYWAAADGRGHLDVLALSAPEDAEAGVALRQRFFAESALPAMLFRMLSHAVPQGPPRACAATAVCRGPADQDGYIYAGDSALAVDPLSGNGIYETLAASPAVVAAVNTWLETAEWGHVRRFLTERSLDSWARKLQAAASFYDQATSVEKHPFWARTARAYRACATPLRTIVASRVHLDRRPVLNGSRIELRRVLVGPRWPRGVWRFRDIELAEIIDSREHELETATRLGVDVSQVRDAVQWINQQQKVSRTAGETADAQGEGIRRFA